MEDQMELADKTCCNSTDDGSHKEDYQYPYSAISALRKDIESMKTDLEKQAKSTPQPEPVVPFSPAPFREQQMSLCFFVAAFLIVTSPFMIVFGPFLMKLFGVFGLNLGLFSLFVGAAVAFNAIEYLGVATFNWCVGGAFLISSLVSIVFIALIWVNAEASIAKELRYVVG
ncbi:hypothetical protein I9W82_003300 [Candida metapsilosis]|uniref:Uncharacterized protein n=1 Tax=Candida metapsilosis TaxID=273372 RepID=A0A8H7ZCT7_9ASCO|nr:hypothetical protein I9W82_003300 [Candida metapsilosis]